MSEHRCVDPMGIPLIEQRWNGRTRWCRQWHTVLGPMKVGDSITFENVGPRVCAQIRSAMQTYVYRSRSERMRFKSRRHRGDVLVVERVR